MKSTKSNIKAQHRRSNSSNLTSKVPHSSIRHSGEAIESSPDEDVSILSPPSAVPRDGQDPSSRSPSVWFAECPEDTNVSTGRALRLSCKVNAKGPVGKWISTICDVLSHESLFVLWKKIVFFVTWFTYSFYERSNFTIIHAGVSWYHNGTLMHNTRTTRIWRSGTHHYLHLFALDQQTAGAYSVAAYTASHCVWCLCTVRCKGN